MAEITTSGSDADRSFGVRWEKALGQLQDIAGALKQRLPGGPK